MRIQETLDRLLEYKFKKYFSEAPSSIIMSLRKSRGIYSKENINKVTKIPLGKQVLTPVNFW